MRAQDAPELPADKQQLYRKAVRLQWFSIVYLLSAIALLALTLGGSQAMKAAWTEDILSLTPPIAFLIAARVRDRSPNARFPYGYHRSVGIAYLSAALSLLTLGAYILYESVAKLIAFERPSIGLVELGGQQVWLGWLMIPALLYSAIPPLFLGRAKARLAEQLHDKVLYADGEMNRADWMTGLAAILGILGIGAGIWWADAVAAIVISLDIVRDGAVNVRTAVGDLMDSRPKRYDHSAPHPLPRRVLDELLAMDWVADARVRLREEGHVFAGDVLVVPRPGVDVVARVVATTEQLKQLDWRLQDLVISPVDRIEDVRPEPDPAELPG